MKKNFKRWLALFLAIALVATSAVYTSGTSLKATSEDLEAQTEQQADGTEVNQVQAEGAVTNPDAGTQATDETGEEKQEIVVDQTVAEQPTADTTAAPEAPEEAAVAEYDVVFHKPAVEGGAVRLWADGGEQKDVAYDGNAIYTEKFPEGTLLNFQITANSKYTVEQVTDQNGVQIAPLTVNENVYAYQVFVSANTEITTLYKEVPQTNTEEPAKEDKTPAEETKKDTAEDTKKDTTEETKKDAAEDIEYTLHISHVLHTSIGNFHDEAEVKLSKEDFTEGSYDVLSQASTKEGIVLSTDSLLVKTEDFNKNNEASVSMKYEVAEGFKAVSKTGKAARAIYVGTFDDVEIVPEGQIPVTVAFVYENGTLAAPSQTIMVVEGSSTDGGYAFSYKIPEKEGYTIGIAEKDKETYKLEGQTITANLPNTAKSGSVNVIYLANDADYTVNYLYQKADGSDGYELGTPETKSGKSGELTEVQPPKKDGFTAQAVEQQEIKADGSTTVEVKYARNTYSVSYDSNGGTYVSPLKGVFEQTVKVYGDGAQAKDPKRQGYVFDGWFSDKECTVKAAESVKLTENQTVYAKWNPDNADYTVAYFKQVWDNNTDSGYYIYTGTTEVKSAKVGDKVQVEATPADVERYTNYKFGHSGEEVVQADGKTIVPVYFDLIEYTIKFSLTDGVPYSKNSTLTMNGKTYKDKEYSITAVVGQDISTVWPTADKVSTNTEGPQKPTEWFWDGEMQGYGYGSTLLPGQYELRPEMLEILSGKGVTPNTYTTYTYLMLYHSDIIKEGSVTIYLEQLDGKYTISKKYSQKFPVQNVDDDMDQGNIKGYTKIEAPAGYPKDPIEIEREKHEYIYYYNINRFVIEYVNADTTVTKTDPVPVGSDIKKYDKEPKRPENLDEGYKFKGWYDNALFVGEKYKFTEMPNSAIRLYAKWEAEREVTLDYNYGDKTEVSTVANATVLKLPTLEREGYLFEGWYTDKDCKTQFDYSQPIEKDLTLYAKWTANTNTTYTVRYVVKDDAAEGGYKDIADKKTGTGVVGATIIEKSKLMEGDYSKYVVNKSSQSLELKSAASENVILFVYSAQKNLKYTVQYVYEGKVVKKETDLESQASQFRVYPKESIVKELVKEGYAANEAFVNAILGTEENIITFTLSRKAYTITYKGLEDVTGWASGEGTENPNKATYTNVDDDFALVNPKKEGFTFQGWKLTGGQVESGDASDEKNVVISKGSKGNLIFTATWKENTYTVKFDVNGGKESIADKTDVKWSDKGLVPAVRPTRDNYKFYRWLCDKKTLNNDRAYSYFALDRQTESITFVAEWERDFTGITVEPYEGVYDGAEHSVEVSGTIEGDVVQYTTDDGLSWVDSISYKDVRVDNDGKYPVLVKVSNGQGQAKLVETYIKILPREVEIKADNAEKEYDGTALTKNSYTVVKPTIPTDKGFVGEEGIKSVTVEGSQLYVGRSSNKITDVSLKDNTKEQNYKIDPQEGLLEVKDRINKYPIEVKSKGGSGTYTGNEQSVKGFETLTFVVNGQTYRVDGIEAGTVGTDAGTYPSEITGTPTVWDSFQKDVTDQFKIKLTEGKLVIKKAVATVTADSLTKTYGSENPKLTYQSKRFLNGDSPESLNIVPKLETTATKASTVTATGYPITFADPVKETTNYKIDYVSGILTITQYNDTILVEAGSAKRGYNGLPLTEDGVSVTGKLAEGDHVVATMSAASKRTVVGETENAIESCKIFNKDNKDVTDQYKHIQLVNGKLQIEKADLTITADSVTKEYGADVPTLTSTATGLQNEETLAGLGLTPTLTSNATATSPVKDGGYAITFENQVTEAENYNLHYADGVLTVTPSSREVVITASSDSKTYDGNKLSKATASATGLVSGDSIGTLLMTQESEVTDVKDTATPNKIATAKIVNGAGLDVTSNYSNIKTADGTLKINPAKITVQAEEKGKVKGQIDPRLTYAITQDSTVAGQKAALSGGLTRESGEDAGEYEISKGELTLTNNGAFMASNYSLIVLPGIFKITAPDYSITKSISNTSLLKKFEANEKVEFDIVVKNNSKYPVKNLTVTDNLTGASGKAEILADDAYTVNADGAAIIAELQGGASITVKARYTVSQDDIDKQNKIVNTATVTDNNSDPKESGEVEVPIKTGSAEVTGTKEIIAQAGVGENGYKVGETVKFKITVNNAGTATLTNVQVKEELDGAVITAGAGYTISDGKTAVINKLNPGSTIEVYAEYTVKQSDVNDGNLKNIARITGNGPDGINPPNGDKVDVDVPTENERVDVITKKSITNLEDATGKDGNFAVDDVVKFAITVKNNGNTTLKGVTVGEDRLPGATIVESEDGKYTVTDNVATIASIEPKDTATVNAQYIVKQTDVDNGKATNNATINIPDKTKPQDPSTDIITEQKDPKISINKDLTVDTAQPEYKFGDTAYFDITVKNEGNVTLRKITVAEMDGATIETLPDSSYSIIAGKAVIENLAVGNSVVVKASYTVTQQDIDKGTAVNTATVKADELKSEQAQKQIPLTAQTPKMTSEKSLVAPFGSGEDGAFRVGETAHFEIKVTNTGNVTLKNIRVEEMAGALVTEADGYNVVDGVAEIDTLGVGATVTVKAQYTVTQTDVDNGGATNKATVTGEGQNQNPPDPNEPSEEIPTEKERLDIVTAKTVTNEGTGTDKKFKAGDLVTFDITVTNNGNTTLKGVTVGENQLPGATIVEDEGNYTVAGNVATIASIGAGKTATVKAQYTVTQSDVDNGGATNIATVDVPNKVNPQDPPADIITEPKNPSVSVEKAVTSTGSGADGTYKAGDVATFTIKVSNNGNVTLKNIPVKETLPGATFDSKGTANATIDKLAPGASETLTASYTVTQDDIDNGAVINNIATSTAPGTQEPEPSDPTPITPETGLAKLGIEKVINNKGSVAGEKFALGQKPGFDITVRNTGNLTLTNVRVTDQLAGARILASTGYTVDGTGALITELKPGTFVIVKAEYAITQDDVDNGGVTNTASATGFGPNQKNPDEVTTDVRVNTVDQAPAAITDKVIVGKTSGFKVGEMVLFDITVKNTGNTRLKNVVVKETLEGAKIEDGAGYTVADNTATIGTIEVGDTAAVRVSYIVTQADMDRGTVTNTATVEIPGEDNPQNPQEPIPLDPQAPSVTVEKTVTPGTAGTGADGTYKAGDVAKFTITVSNNGNVTLTNIPVKEELPGAIFDKTGTANATITELAPGASETLTASYTVTQDDIDNGAVINNIATSTAPGTQEPEPSDPTPITPETGSAKLGIEKVINNKDSVAGEKFALGQKPGFDITVSNTGNLTLTNVRVTDELAGASILDSTGYTVDGTGALITELKPGASVIVKAEYTIIQDDVDNGGVTNTASATGFGPNQKNPDEVTTDVRVNTVDQAPAAITDKVIVGNADRKTSGFKVGEMVLFDITVKNTGNIRLKNVIVKETLEGAKIEDGAGYTVADNIATIGTIEVGATAKVRASYKVSQADMDRGTVTNAATVEIPGEDNPQNPQRPIPLDPQAPSVTVEKTVTPGTAGTGADGTYKVGDVAKFTIKVSNNGNVTLKNIPVKEELAGAIFDSTGKAEAVITELAPAASETLTASYTVTQDDIDSGAVINNIATSTAPGTQEPEPSDPTPIIPEKQNPSVAVTKEVTPDTSGTGADGTYKANEVAHFTITVTNTGNVTLKEIPVNEILTGATFDETGTAEAKIAELAPGASKALAASYTVTQQDVDKGDVINNVATATAPGTQSPEPSEDTPITPEEKNPAVTIAKAVTDGTAGTGEGGTYKAGDVAKYTITVTNGGNVTLKNIPVTEELDGATFDSTGTAEANIPLLAVGESTTLAVSYTVTQDDIDSGRIIENIATATAPGTTTPEETDPVPVTPETWSSSYTSAKTITNEGTGENGSFKVGEQANFTITVSNTGNTTLKNITVADQLEGAAIVNGTGYTVNGDGQALIDSLAPGNEAVVYAQYTVTQADVDNGGTSNVAAVTAEAPGDNQPDPQNPSVEVTTDTQKPDLTTSKSLTNEGTGEGGAFKAGETAEFEISVTNSGNVTQKNITVAEGLDGAVILEGSGYTVEDGKAIINELAVAASVKVNAEYTITQADIDGGATIINTAIVDGGENNPQDPQEPIPTEKPDANLGVSKTILNAQDSYLFGETIQYQITASNDGNVTLNNVVINDLLTNASGNIVVEESDQYSVEGNVITIKQLAPGASIVINCNYTVTRADAGNAITNTATGTSDETTTPKSDTTDGSTVGELYTMTIHYVDEAGATMAPDYTGQFGEKENVTAVVSPTIDGYTMNYASIGIDGGVMPANDLEFTVTYTVNPVVTPIAPVPPTDTVTPVTPAGPVLVTVQTTPVPAAAVDVVATPDENGDYVLTPVADVDTPLANKNLDDHACCVLHFLLMLLALIILIFYTRSMKKRQARIFKLEEKVRIEMAKRGLEQGKKDAE